jgi:hypothetical protein
LRHLGNKPLVDMFNSGTVAIDKFREGDRAVSLRALRASAPDSMGIPGDTRRFAEAELLLDSIKLDFARPDELIGSKASRDALREYYLLQSGKLDGTLSLTNYRGALLHTKKATKQRVLNSPPTDEQLLFNPVTGRYEDARMYAPNPSVLTHRLELVSESTDLKAHDKAFIKEFIDELGGHMGVNERAVITDNLRISFERFRRSGTPWGNTKAVLNSQLQFDVTNISESLETAIRADADPLKRLKELAFIDPVLGPTSLDDIQGNFVKDIIERNKFDEKTIPKIAKRVRRQLFPGAITGKLDESGLLAAFGPSIPFKIWNRMDGPTIDQFFEGIVRRLALADLPDRDALAVSIGRSLYENANYRGSKEDWYNTGLAILHPLERKGMISLETFGVQKRRMRSRITGQYFGQYYDTFSETVRVMDKDILRYAELNRRIDLGLRVGFSQEPTLIVRPGYKTYYIKAGNIDTKIPITSDSSFGDFPAEAITRDMAEALNWAAHTKYKIDNSTYDAIHKLLYFVDDRGKAKYYDELNHFRKYLTARGDAYERFKAMQWHREGDTSFSYMPFLDHRGRIYDRGLIGPQSGETFRPFLAATQEKPLGEEGYHVFEDQVGSFFGGLNEKFEGRFNSLTVTGRAGISAQLRPEMVKIGRALMRGKPNDLRYILESDMLQAIDGEDYAKSIRLCIEAAKIDDFLKGNYSDLSRLSDYRTALVLEQDASSSGAQIIAMTTKNRQLAELSNVVPTEQKQRLYDEIAARTFMDPRFIQLNKKLGLTERDLRKAAKAQNMVTLYGAGVRTGTINVERKLAKVLDKDSSTLVVSSVDRDKVLSEISARMARYQKYDPETYEQLARLRTDVKDIFGKGQAPGDEIMEALYFLDPETRLIVEKMSRQYDRVVTPGDFSLVAKIMSENLATQAPILRDFTKYFGRLAETFLLNASPAKASIDFKYEVYRRMFGQAAKAGPEQKFLSASSLKTVKDKLSFRGYLPNFKPNADRLDKRRLIHSKYFKEVIQRTPGWNPHGLFHTILFGEDRADPSKNWVHVPWVNFDGVVMEQYFTQSFEERLSYKNANGEWVTNILMIDQKTAPTLEDEIFNASDKAQSISDITKAKTAYAVNGNHSNDAVLVKRFHSWGRENNVPTSTIHDAFFTHISDMPKAKEALKAEYARAIDSTNVKATLDEMLRRGLPKKDYDEFLEEAIRIGIIPVPGKSIVGGKVLRESDILKGSDVLVKVSNDDNYSWYAVGG